MTKEEALHVLAILKAAYPSSYNGMTKREATGTATVWYIQFADVPVDIVLMAIQKLISTSKFPPAISEVKSKIGSLHWEAYSAMSSPLLSEEAKNQYKRIYDLTKSYKVSNMVEPSLLQMLEGGHMLQLETGGADQTT